MGCQSAFSVISSLWKNYGDIAKKLGCTAAGVATENPQVIIECLEKIGKVEESYKQMKGFWDKMSGDDSWATLGPRELPLKDPQEGKLVGTSGRTFISNPFRYDKARIVVRERDGKAKTEINICVMDGKGHTKELKTALWNEDKDEKKNLEHQKIDFVASGVKGKCVIVHLDGKSVANTFAYTVRLEKGE
jgi:hypothetical protein